MMREQTTALTLWTRFALPAPSIGWRRDGVAVWDIEMTARSPISHRELIGRPRPVGG
ncbi:hypothetical protein [Rhodococcus sp. NPDC057529]|uniref:hypothetical protein n=1 Tax=Rhodococcus sp. NPDC057529 TaxID=3346158 RepID=UPI0036724C99